jgi:hypothetical protein
MSITVTLNVDGPREPGYLLEVGESIPEGVRVANHLTFSHDSLRYPAEADSLLRYLAAAAAGYPQLLEQVLHWLEVEQQAGRVRVADDRFTGDPAGAIAEVRTRLDTARTTAEALWVALSSAASVTSTLGAEGHGDD